MDGEYGKLTLVPLSPLFEVSVVDHPRKLKFDFVGSLGSSIVPFGGNWLASPPARDPPFASQVMSYPSTVSVATLELDVVVVPLMVEVI